MTPGALPDDRRLTSDAAMNPRTGTTAPDDGRNLEIRFYDRLGFRHQRHGTW